MDFSRLALRLEYPMVVVTVAAPGGPSGCLVGFHTQVSIHPPRYLVCLSKENHTTGLVEAGSMVGVHFVRSEARPTAEWFGAVTADDPAVDKAAAVTWRDGPGGVPLIDGVDMWMAGRVGAVVDLGDHVAHVVEPIEVAAPDDDPDLLGFRRLRDLDPGHPP